ncbi:C40 family peptidase [Bacillus badius]|uniref:3D domain-containing protein n=1 Tax=Bacillus badius TaxID=1455 RepID=UPI001CC13A73|nr:3D domain-containing protein [Bacillus badius]UAT29403.1 C40 family peptidase [Bacillus badius]
MALQRVYQEFDERMKPTLHFYLYTPDYRYDFTEFVTGHEWSGDINIAGETFEITTYNKQLKNDRRQLPFEEGYMVKVMLEYPTGKGFPGPTELFRGVITARTISGDGTEQLRVQDYNWYLQQNEITIKFQNKTADQIIAHLCRVAGVGVNYMDKTKHVFAELEFIEKTLWEIIQTVLTETYLRTKKRYNIRSEYGKLALREVTMSPNRMIIERGKNLLGSTREVSIEEVKTQVIMTSGESQRNTRVVKVDAAAKKKYGTLTAVEHTQDVYGPGGLSALAQGFLDELKKPSDHVSVEALADYNISAGTLIEAYDPTTGMNDYYFVTAHSHSGQNGYSTMQLELSKSYNPEFVPYEKPDEDKAEGGETADLDSKLDDISYMSGFIGTAYDPRLGGINGSGDYSKTATGTKWAYKRTIAVSPKIIPYGSVVHINVPTMPEFTGLYLAEDTGGAIRNENGGKRVDVLIEGRTNTSRFGRRNVEVAILEKGKGAADARAKAAKWNSIKAAWQKKLDQRSSKGKGKGAKTGDPKRDKVVELARSYKGKLTYKFGGKNIPSGRGDCSGFTFFIFKQIGVNLGHGTMSQITKGKKIATSAAQPGDLVFFKGTIKERGANAVSHVGIVTRPGYCVSLANSGCKEHGYLPSTNKGWGKSFMQINRVL